MNVSLCFRHILWHNIIWLGKDIFVLFTCDIFILHGWIVGIIIVPSHEKQIRAYSSPKHPAVEIPHVVPTFVTLQWRDLEWFTVALDISLTMVISLYHAILSRLYFNSNMFRWVCVAGKGGVSHAQHKTNTP